MTYLVELKPEVARNIEAQAAQKGVKPEEFLGELAENVAQPQHGTIPDEQFQASKKKIFTKYAKVFEALAEGAK